MVLLKGNVISNDIFKTTVTEPRKRETIEGMGRIYKKEMSSSNTHGTHPLSLWSKMEKNTKKIAIY